MYFYAARQPILDVNKKLYAYELLFRDSIDNVFPDIDGDEATSKMIEASKFNMGISDFTGNKPAFINFTLETLAQGYPEMLTNEEVVVEILETVKPGKKLLGLCKNLHSKGYIIALDDYEHQSVWAHFYPFIKIIKIDIQQTNFDQVKKVIDAIKEHPHIELLAEKVELSVPRLTQLFRIQTGVAIRRYRLWHRLFRSVVDFASNGSLTNSALGAGFSDASHFNRTFRSMFGMAPKHFLTQANGLKIYTG